MTDQYVELVMEELGLMPLWVRPELVVTTPTKSAATSIEPAVPIAAPIVVAAPVPVILETPPRPSSPPPPARHIPASIAPPPVAVPQLLERDERAQRISALDWEALQAETTTCTACGLCKSRNKVVFGTGQPKTDWLVIGEAPGAEEDRQGKPFVGQAGKLLDNMLTAVGRSRQENVYILNTLKCRPPQNRNPQPDEMALCAPILHRQIELIQPKVIFAVGRFAVQALLGREATIASLRGKLHDYRGIPVVVSYHPAYLLRNLPDKIKAWHDLLLANKVLADHSPK
ncbi:uracil-DNA glycosylase [Chitinimonas sp. BJB300]|uniref:uracil-DNA glycosylase n=1 Tax=Chitinimonas sp. BJB300 TaxID=1559339 RepID=UPI000C0F0413|nr:uracil-DNA glycosylase [Chitinimonas sp. BJB300]PHV11532.1 uracil-DNA glycosylase [Chitinimonas sp. BJB300]TSJ87240.1 uracil-DNA glycosylase [Chitinimonas sp. BJB300]